ncbi:hypothetical protein GGR57DRAFT_506879 [Xylariaceae sp. FL1272]|nr:hypothetical protein GGR57DRAFT_506879 [Xylariaceae sp. FL1272]
MAPSQNQGKLSAATSLNAALFEFGARFAKEQLQQLARECDERCEQDLVPRLQALLRDIDAERDGFEKQKQHKILELRSRLSLLDSDSDAIETAVAQLCSVTPKSLDLVLSGPSLGSPIQTATEDASQDSDVPSTGDTHQSNDEQLVQGRTDALLMPITTPSSIDTQLQAHVLAESSAPSQTSKRPRPEKRDENASVSKRPKVSAEDDEPEAATSAKLITREVAFPNLATGECIFRHSTQKGFFVVRCDQCDVIFSEPPLAYNRALKHFNKHGVPGKDKEELTNEDIFEQFAYQVSGADMASKYWVKEHLGAMPHTFTSTRSAEVPTDADEVEDMMPKHKEIDDDFSPPFPKVRESPRNHTVDRDPEVETHRRPLRNVPRPDYAEMIAGKAPWEEASDVGSEAS